VDPHQPEHVFTVITGKDGRGLYESTDGGATWKKNPVDLRDRAKIAIPHDRAGTGNGSPAWELAVPPSQPETVCIVAGDRGGWTSLLHGICKTTDGGTTWKKIHPDEYVYSLLVDPSDSNTIYAGARGVVYKSTDAGTTWQNLSLDSPASDVVALTIDPADPALLWAGLDARGKAGAKTGVLVSSDGGATWQEFSHGLGCKRITCLAIDSRRPHSIVAGTAGGGVWSLRLVNRLVKRRISSR